MTTKLFELLGFSLIGPGVTSIIRYRKINSIYLPFILYIWAGLLNELLSYFLINKFHVSNNINNNIYLLIESVLFIWLFYRWNLFSSNKGFFWMINFILAIWIADNCFISGIRFFASYFMVVYSFIIVLMSIQMINRVVAENSDLISNPIFLICTCFIIYYTLSVIVGIFWIYGLKESQNFLIRIYRVTGYLNFIINLIYAIAIIWMPRKQELSLPL